MRILAVDDDPIFLEILARALLQYGEADVTMASSAKEALAEITSSTVPFDLFLFDILMPEIDGVELVRRVRKIPGNEQTPIMMITKVTQRDYVDKAFQAGATDYLTKPLDSLEFHGRIGVMKRLIHENTKRRELLREIARGGTGAARTPFEEPITAPNVDCMIEHSVLSNYLSVLGLADKLGVSLVCIRVENMASIYARCNQNTLIDVVGSIATTLFSSMRPRLRMLSYLGGGNFICVLNGRSVIDTGEMLSALEFTQSGSGEKFYSKALPMPVFRIGRQVSMGVFSNRSASQVVESAVKSARGGFAEQSAPLRMSA